jgi:hypothetical protein
MHGQKKILEDRRGREGTSAAAGQKVEESDATHKPLATALMQEFQSLKDKFKSEDGEGEKGNLFVYSFV